MFYGYVKLEDETQFTYSELRDDHTVLVCVERPVDMGFDSAECLLPAFIERGNWDRPHSACGGLPPMSRIVGVNNLSAHNT